MISPPTNPCTPADATQTFLNHNLILPVPWLKSSKAPINPLNWFQTPQLDIKAPCMYDPTYVLILTSHCYPTDPFSSSLPLCNQTGPCAFYWLYLAFPTPVTSAWGGTLSLSFEAHCKHKLFHEVGPDGATDKISAAFGISSSLCCLLGIKLVLCI